MSERRISYAQNFEDVILWRAVGHVADGFYIDVGAQDPVLESVSMMFHEAGWDGVSVEPSPPYARAMRAARPGSRLEQAAVSRERGRATFHDVADTGLSTLDADIAQRHRRSGFRVDAVDVEVITLADIFETIGGRTVHWLKIDVEGAEADVVAGWQPSPVRPWVVVLESVAPVTGSLDGARPEPLHEAWEPQLLELGYTFAYFDGLNRFYVSNEQLDLLEAFGPGPNLFDGFALYEGLPLCAPVREAHEATLAALRVAEHRGAHLLHINADLARLLADSTRDRLERDAAQIGHWQTRVTELEGKVAERERNLSATRASLSAAEAECASLMAELERLRGGGDREGDAEPELPSSPLPAGGAEADEAVGASEDAGQTLRSEAGPDAPSFEAIAADRGAQSAHTAAEGPAEEAGSPVGDAVGAADGAVNVAAEAMTDGEDAQDVVEGREEGSGSS